MKPEEMSPQEKLQRALEVALKWESDEGATTAELKELRDLTESVIEDVTEYILRRLADEDS